MGIPRTGAGRARADKRRKEFSSLFRSLGGDRAAALDALDALAQEDIESGIMPQTKAGYKSGWNGWLLFCAEVFGDYSRSFPAQDIDLVRYASFLKLRHTGPSVVVQARQAIGFFHRAHGIVPNPATQNRAKFAFRAVIKALEREKPRRPAFTLPGPDSIRLRSLATDSRQPIRDYTDLVVCVVAIVSLLRGGDLGAVMRGHIRPLLDDGVDNLLGKWKKVLLPTKKTQLTRASIKLFVPHQKWKKGATWKTIVADPSNPDRCVPTLIRQYLARVGLSSLDAHTDGQYIFRSWAVGPNGKPVAPNKPLSAQAVNLACKRVFARLGHFGSHEEPVQGRSLRRTGADFGRQNGLSIDQVMELGNWEAAATARLYLSGPFVTSGGAFDDWADEDEETDDSE